MRFASVLVLSACMAYAQGRSGWTDPFPAHRIIGPVYYVGTADLACYLITSPAGHILINTGLAESGSMIRKNVGTLGFKVTDIRILLTNQAHFDHVAAFPEIKKISGAKMMATEADKAVIEDGGRSDFLPGESSWFTPIKVDGVIKDGETISLGDIKLRAHVTPGHTRGSVTYSMRVRENGRDYNVLFANMPSVIGAPLIGNKKYPEIARDFEKSFRVQKALACDVFLAAHGSQYNLAKKYKQTYDPNAFVDPEGYRTAIAAFEQRYQDQRKQEQEKLR
jgi:metallo-beta-lactamase class B